MTKKKGRGRSHPPQRRPVRSAPTGPTREDDAEGQELFQSLRAGLRSKEPLELLSMVSGLLAVTDPRGLNPFDADEERPKLADLVDSLIDTPYAETTAALTAMRALVPDEVLAARIGRALAERRHPLPRWLAHLGQTAIDPEVWFLTDVLGDGDDYVFGATLASGDPVSVVVYVDHNLGTVVKDAFLVPSTPGGLAEVLRQQIDPANQTLSRIDAATARAVVTEAIEHGAMMVPPLESDSWPMCRPLVEWLLRLLPAGGSVPDRPEWTEEAIAALTADFFASAFGTEVDGRDVRDLLGSVLWFGTDYGPGDPLRWSPAKVELLLADWFPRKVVAEPAYLAKMPHLLRAFIRYTHDRVGIEEASTAEALAAVDDLEPEYQRTIRTSRPQGPAALLARMLSQEHDVDGLVGLDGPLGEALRSVAEIMLETLDDTVGGRYQLQTLDDAPLPDEPFEWAGVADDIRPVVAEVLASCDRCADEILDVEHRTAMRRFLSRAAVGDPAIFRRKASPVRAAAAVAWVICRANDTVGGIGQVMGVKELMAWFGVTGSVSQRAEPFLRANGVNPHGQYGAMRLGVADLLTSQRRAEIIEHRDRYLGEERV